MSYEIRELRSRWQNHRQSLMRADHNHADEELARALYFADTKPIIAEIVGSLRHLETYMEFDARAWLEGRKHAGTLGSGLTNVRLSLDEAERAAQCLKILELANQKFEQSQHGLWTIGLTTHSGHGSGMIDSIRSAIDVIFEPFYQFTDAELRTRESLITPVDIVRDLQTLVDNRTSMQYPETHKLLQDAYQQLFTLTTNTSGASWNQIGYACRHILIRFADETFKPDYVPSDNEQPKKDDADEKLKWTTRYCLRQQGIRGRYEEGLEKIVDANWTFVNAVGHKQESATKEDARLALIYTYLTIKVVDQAINGPTSDASE